MKDTLFILGIFTVFWISGALFGASFAATRNWVHNRTKKVCDLCFRDIKRWREEIEKYKKEHSENK